MSRMDLGVVNGLVYREGVFEKTNLYVKGGVISRIGNELLDADSVYDAAGKWVLPGLIDPHVHFKLGVGATVSRDDFTTGSQLAAFGGVTTIIDFLDPTDTLEGMKEAFERRKEDARGCHVDYSFHPTIKGFRDPLDELGRFILSRGMPSVKLFTTYGSTGRQTGDRLLADLFRESEKSKFTVLIHAENDGMIDESPGAPFADHGRRRPPLSEISEVIKLAQMCEYAGGYCYIVHTNCGTTLEKLREGFPRLLEEKRFFIESCPHYLLFDSRVYGTDRGYRYVMTPPLRPEGEREKLCEQIDGVDTIGTDHCPYREDEKNHALLDRIPNGIEGIPYTLPVLYGLFGEKILPKMTHDCARIHGLYPRKGTLKEGSDGDILIFDPGKSVTFGESMPWHRSLNRDGSSSPYYGCQGKGEVCATFLRGMALMEEGRFRGNRGQFLERKYERNGK